MFKKLLLLSSFLIATNAFSLESITATPTSWLLQNYVGGNVIVFNTGSECSGGHLNFASSVSNRDKDRFWSLVMTAKIASKQIRVYYTYDSVASTCFISSFLLY